MNMRRITGMVLIMIAAGAAAVALPPEAPEIDPGSVTSALALLAGAMMIIRGRRRS
jgi:hypothetical protein